MVLIITLDSESSLVSSVDVESGPELAPRPSGKVMSAERLPGAVIRRVYVI